MSEPKQSSYRDLIVWQRSLDLVDAILDLTENLNTPQKHYRLIEQFESSVASIPMNIAEGKGRRSKKEFLQFLYIARASLYETVTLLEIFKRRNWITEQSYQNIFNQSTEIAKMLNGLIRSIADSD
jgi:four helix bundle protein